MSRVRGNPAPIVGLCAFTHDSAAALVVDGALVGFVEEERLNGEKHTRVYPARALDWLLGEGGLASRDVGVVAYNIDGRHHREAVLQTPAHLVNPATRARALPRARSFAYVHRRHRHRMRELAAFFPKGRVTSVGHHRTHGLYALASSGYEDAAVLVVDSLGEIQTTTIAHGRSGGAGGCADYRVVAAIDDPASLGYAYGAITEHLGWRRGDEEGTVMALAALGDPARFRSVLERAIRVTPDGFALDPTLLPLRVLASQYERTTPAFAAATCAPRRPGEPVEQVHADLAAALQERTEQVMVHLARRARQLTGSHLLCLAGGVAMNCLSVGRIVETGLFDEVHVPPAPGDSGTAIGAAIGAHLDRTGRLPAGVEDRCYLGPSFPGLELPAQPRPGLVAHKTDDPARVLAAALAEGSIVGVFQGRAEAGPRALGNRSILASPLQADVVERLNATVKYREPFRPFAPVVLADKAADYVTLPQPAPYMSIATGVTDLTRRHVPAVVHANGTARVQTVTHDQNPFLAAVVAHFADRTGVPVLVNTSLNVKGRPVCGTPEMALDCLVGSGLDALLIEDWWVTR